MLHKLNMSLQQVTQGGSWALLSLSCRMACSIHSNSHSSTNIMQPGVVPSLVTNRALDACLTCQRFHRLYWSDCCQIDQETPGLTCFPSWRAMSLHSTDQVLPGLVPIILTHSAFHNTLLLLSREPVWNTPRMVAEEQHPICLLALKRLLGFLRLPQMRF